MEKNDFLQVLPGELSKLLFWMATDKGRSFQEFKDHVITMSGRTLFNERTSHRHAVVRSLSRATAAMVATATPRSWRPLQPVTLTR